MTKSEVAFLLAILAAIGLGVVFLGRASPGYYQMDMRCEVAYQAAANSEDTARVDAIMISFPSGVASVSCGYQRRRVELADSLQR